MGILTEVKFYLPAPHFMYCGIYVIQWGFLSINLISIVKVHNSAQSFDTPSNLQHSEKSNNNNIHNNFYIL